MIEAHGKQFWTRQSDAFRLSAATGLGSLAAAGALALCSFTESALHAAQGVAIVGLFYLAIALGGACWRTPQPQPAPGNRLPRSRFASRPAGGIWERN